jgi:hypothetical protein
MLLKRQIKGIDNDGALSVYRAFKMPLKVPKGLTRIGQDRLLFFLCRGLSGVTILIKRGGQQLWKR